MFHAVPSKTPLTSGLPCEASEGNQQSPPVAASQLTLSNVTAVTAPLSSTKPHRHHQLSSLTKTLLLQLDASMPSLCPMVETKKKEDVEDPSWTLMVQQTGVFKHHP